MKDDIKFQNSVFVVDFFITFVSFLVVVLFPAVAVNVLLLPFLRVIIIDAIHVFVVVLVVLFVVY